MAGNAIEFKLGADSRALKTGLDAAKGQVREFKSQIGGILTGLFAGIGIDSLIQDFARVQDLADQFGTTAESVQRVRGAADTAGTSVEFLAKQMAKVTIEANKIAAGGASGLQIAGEGGSEAAKGFAALNINAAEFAKMGLEDQLLAVAKGMDAIPEEGDKIAAAYQLFGAKGKEIIPLLLQGFQNLQAEFAQTAVLSNDMVRSIADADDTLARVGNTVKVGFASAFGYVADKVKDASAGIGDLLYLSQRTFGAIGEGFEKLKTGDLKGAAKAFATEVQSGLQDTRDAVQARQLEEWQKEQMNGKGSGKKPLIDPESINGPATAGAEKRLTLEERLAALADERARKQLDVENQILDLKKMQEDATVRANAATDPREKKSAEDEAFNAAKEIYDLQDRQQKQKIKDEQDAAKIKVDGEKQAAEEAKRAQMDVFAQRKASIGFAGGGAGVTADSGLIGVNYKVANTEAQKSIDLQKEMTSYLKTISEKEFTADLPEAE